MVATHLASVCIALLIAVASTGSDAQSRPDPGISDTEIKIGQTMPYSGPASAYATIGKVEGAYYRMINERGGVNGRKITLISLDDGFNPAKTVEHTRMLVEEEGVFAIVGSLGTAPNTAIHKYLNARKVPHIYLSTGASKWGDPKRFPWTMGWLPTYAAEARAYARYILANHPKARIGVLYQNDDLGRDYLQGLGEGLGDKAKAMIVAQQSFEIGDPTVDSQIISLKASGADVLVNISTPKAAVQSIRKMAQIRWKPVHFIAAVSSSTEIVMKPAGVDNAKGTMSVSFIKDVSNPALANDPAVQEYRAFMKKHYPDGDPDDVYNAVSYSRAQTFVHLLERCGKELTRESLMKQAASLRDFRLPLLYEGVRLNTSAEDFYPIEEFRMIRFDGSRWVEFGDVISGH